jgi:hypothetical protein
MNPMKSISRIKKVYFLAFVYFNSIASSALAADAPPAPVTITPFGPASGDFEVIIASVLEKLIQFGTLLLAVMIVWTGFLFVKSGGAPDQLATAKKSLIATIIGGAIILGAMGLSELVVDTVGGV